MAAHPTPQSTPATVMKARGPSRSISQPEQGMIQVSSAMNSVKAHCTSERAQPCAARIGSTKKVHAY